MNLVSYKPLQAASRIPTRAQRKKVSRQTLIGILLILTSLVGCESVLAQGSVDPHLNDSGIQMGREPVGAFAPPAALDGTERPDTASFQMEVPLLSLAGRGLNVNLALHYNSSIYQLNSGSVSEQSKGLEWPAFSLSMGYGKLIVHNTQILGCQEYVIPATTYCGGHPPFPPLLVTQGAVQNTFIDGAGTYHRLGGATTIDSSDLRSGSESGNPTIIYPDGTKLIFGKVDQVVAYTYPTDEVYCPDNGVIRRCCCKLYDYIYYPTKIVDRNGNFIEVVYGTGSNIHQITDTLGRKINFNYTSNGLASISVPDFTNGDSPQRTVVQFFYQNLTKSGCFSGQQNGCISGTVRVLSFVYFPGTNAGWHYNYSSFGMIYRVEKMVGMSVDASNSISGQIVATTEYNYPGTPLNPATSVPIELPKYTSRTDQWIDVRGTLSPPVTQTFNVQYFGSTHTSVATITAADQITKSEITRRWYTPSEHTLESLNTIDEGIILKEKLTSGEKTYSVVEKSWDMVGTGPRLLAEISTNDTGDTKKIKYEYCPGPATGQIGVLDNVCKVFEYKFNSTTFDASNEVRRTEYAYETDPAWTNRWLVRLIKSIKIFQGGSALPIAQRDFVYDANPPASYYSLPSSYDVNTPNQRGNLTGVLTNTNVADPANGLAICTTASYDVFGNVLSTTDPNGNVTQFDYTDSYSDNLVRNTYAFLTSTISATPDPNQDPNAPHGSTQPLTTATTHNFATGLVTSSRDVRGQTTALSYADPANRLTRVDLPNGSWITQEYFNTPGNIYVRTLNLQETSPAVVALETREYSDGRGAGTRSEVFEGGTWLIIDSKDDLANRTTSRSNPYRATVPDGEINPSNKWTITALDPAGRVFTVTTPDGAQTRTEYYGTLTLVTDTTNRKRLTRSDELGRTTDVWEVTTETGSEPVVFSDQNLTGYHTQYYFDVLGNLRSVTQGAQQRFFAYDSLSRLIRVRNPEQDIRPAFAFTDALTNNSGWTIAYDYDNNGNLRHRTDARGIVTTYVYDALDRLISRSYTNDPTGTPAVSYAYDLAGANSKGQLTSVMSSVSTCQYGNYDVIGRAKIVTEQIGAQSYVLNYDYDLAGHVKSLNYPSGHNAYYSYDAAGRLQNFTGTLGDNSPRDYATGITYDSNGGWTRERFGTTVPLFNKRHYNVRQMLYDMRVSTVDDDTNWNRGAIVNYYSLANPAAGATGPDTNGSIYRQKHWVPTNDAASDYSYTQYDYSYDSLNRIHSSTEFQAGSDWLRPPAYVQTFDYDRWGNRTINPSSWGVNTRQFDKSDAQNTNRLYAPGDTAFPAQQRQMRYDEAGNLTYDVYTGDGSRVYDAEGRIIQAWANGQSQYSTYDGDGHRIKRKVDNVETLQIYGLGGELLAEYSQNGVLQREYGYRNGELLIATNITAGSSWGPPPSFTDDPLNPPNQPPTTIRLGHLTDLRSAVNQLRQHAGLPPYNFTVDPNPEQYVTTVKADHIRQLRSALEEARSHLGLSTSYTHPTLTENTSQIYAIDFQELRNQILSAWNTSTGGFSIHWLVTDQLGSPRMVFDQSGSLTVLDQAGHYLGGVTRHDYLPFGEELPVGLDGREIGMGYGVAEGVRHQFTQYERDEPKLDFAQARHYNNIQGRFTRPDPLVTSANLADPQSWNRYTYCGNDPLDFIDPSGLDWYRNTTETGVIHPVWFSGIPDEPIYVPWDKGFVYWNVEQKCWWWLNPFAFEQGPAASEEQAFSTVGHINSAYLDALGQPPPPPVLAPSKLDYVPIVSNARQFLFHYTTGNFEAALLDFEITSVELGTLKLGGSNLAARSFATKPGEAIFYSGGKAAFEAATETATTEGGKTISMTLGGRALTKVTAPLPERASTWVWNWGSKRFAEGASGNIRVFLREPLRSNSTWNTIESPILRANPFVRIIGR